jgi:pimeloyl-ACP methyl ester carboxylesterase
LDRSREAIVESSNRRGRRRAWCALVVLALPVAAGCSVRDLGTADRMSRGLVIVLPGIEGRSAFNYDIARGLDEGGVSSGIEIYDWNVPIPGGALINLTDYERNVEQARKLDKRIIRYQETYPGRAVHLVGHSGGAGLAVLALEQFPKDRKVTAAILLAGAVSPTHDLTRALARTRYGIFNYYSPADVGFLQIGTSIFGNIDRGHGPAAGAVGFEVPRGMSAASRDEYRKLHQIKWSRRMANYGNPGSHTGWSDRAWVRKYLAPLIVEQQNRPLRAEP